MTKKSTAKKSTAKKSKAKKVAVPEAPVTTVPTASPDPVVAAADPSGAQPEDSKSPTSIAKEIVGGSQRWNSGRDRDELLKRAGHDPEAVRKEVSRLRAAKNRAEKK